MPPMRKLFATLAHAAVADTARAAALLDREELLLEKARHLDVSHPRRSEIEKELDEIRRLLVGLGLRNSSLD